MGAKPGDSREVEAKLGTAVDDASLRARPLAVQVKVNDLKRLRLPELNEEFLDSLDFVSVDALRLGVRRNPQAPARDRAAPGCSPADRRLSAPGNTVRAAQPIWFPARRKTRSTGWWRNSGREGCRTRRSERRVPPRSAPMPTRRPSGRSRNSCSWPRSPKRKGSRSRTRMSASRSR